MIAYESLAQARVLVIDDEPANVRVLVKMLERAGYMNVEGLTDSRVAKERFTDLAPDLVLLDLHMPPPNGFEILEWISSTQAENAYTPVMVITADATDETKEQALMAGANDFLVKPFQMSETLLRVRNLLHTRALHDQLQRHATSLEAQVAEHDAAEIVAAAIRRGKADAVRGVLAGDGLTMVFQPIVDLVDGSVQGAEALARFSPEPMRTPDVWFADAADVGLGAELELHAIGLALDQCNGAGLPAGVFLTVNASAATILSPGLFEMLEARARPGLVVELTEHAHIADYAPLTESLDHLRSLGVRLAVDDAGTGYAGLSHLLQVQPAIIKLDRFLITGAENDPARRALASSLVRFSTENGAMLIAEGIETEVELSVLRDLGVTRGQGYLLARPAPLPLPLSAPVGANGAADATT
jgi:EAL domain-containing protein (putative c-di-GMP-specific phosphodiesterase class I)